jgi:ketosteroid isomerase-like protein
MTEDRGAIQRLAERLIAAEIACDLSVFEAAITDDMVIMPPAVPAIVGRTDCLAFIRTVLEENAAELERNIIEYSSGEICVDGNTGFDRGQFTQILTPRGGAGEVRVEGQYLRVYFKGSDGEWRLARVIWNRIEPDESDEGSGARE